MLIKLARFFEWAFGAVLMTTIAVVLLLTENIFSGFSYWVVIISLFLYLTSTVIRVYDDHGWFTKQKK